MRNWSESRQVFEWLSTLKSEQRRAALATVVEVSGSAYRRPGAKMAVAEDGATVGNVSGGCLEGDVREVALRVLGTGTPELRTYCSTSDEIAAWDLGLGCDGEVRVYVEPAYLMSSVEEALLLYGTGPFAVCTVVDGTPVHRTWHRLVVTTTGHEGQLISESRDERIADRARQLLVPGAESQLQELDGLRFFTDIYHPAPQLAIVGAGNDARPLARYAAEAGFRVSVIDRRSALLAADRFHPETTLYNRTPADAVQPEVDGDGALIDRVEWDANTFVVIMTHNFADDEAYLRALVRTPVRYIGVLGPRQRTERLVQRVAADTPFLVNVLYGPVGLDIGADGAEQVALSILAEILAVRSGRQPRSLRTRRQAIHAASTTRHED